MTPLAGLQVLDLTSGPAGGLATMILSDFGAIVKRVPDPEFNYLNDMPSAHMWLRGKTQCSDFEEEIKTADIMIISTPNGFTGVDLSGFFFEDCREGSLTMTQVQHEEYGPYYRHRPMISFSEGEVSPRAGVPAGAHSRSLMSELGYSANEIEVLLERGILWSA